MRGRLWPAALLCAALLVGCRPAPTETPTPMPTPTMTGVQDLPQTPTPEPLTAEEAAILYARFLQDDLTTMGYSGEGEAHFHSEFFSGLDMERAMDIYRIWDLTGDGIPELYGNIGCSIWSIEDNEVVAIGSIMTWERLTAKGGIFYHRPGAAPEHHDYHYEWLSPESHELPEMGAQTYDRDNDGVLDTFSFWDEEGKWVEASQEAWNEAMAPYFALLEEEQSPHPTFREWAAELEVELPAPEMNEAKAWRIFLPYVLDWEWKNPDKDRSILRVYDFDGDGIPEIYEDTEPYLAYGISGLHVEELGPADELGERPEAPLPFSEWYRQLKGEKGP